MPQYNHIYSGTMATTLLASSTIVASSASGKYVDLANIDGQMLAEVIMTGASAETRGVTVTWLECAAATTTAYSACATTWDMALTGKGAHIETVGMGVRDFERYIKPKFTTNGQSFITIRLFGRYKRDPVNG